MVVVASVIMARFSLHIDSEVNANPRAHNFRDKYGQTYWIAENN